MSRLEHSGLVLSPFENFSNLGLDPLHTAKANNNSVLNDLPAIPMPTILITIPSGWVGPSGWAWHAAANLKAGASCALAAAMRRMGKGVSSFATIASGTLATTMRGMGGV